MQGLRYLIAITRREFEKKYIEFFKSLGVSNVLSNFTNGTANDTVLAKLGIERTEKINFETVIRVEDVEKIKQGLINDMNIGAIGNGIAIFLPIDSLGGKSTKEYFVGDKPILKEESMSILETETVMIVAVVDKGNTDIVMESARSAGASGGTVVRAKGTGADMAKFFGISISEEKEMVYIVAKREKRDDIMYAIMEKAGKDTKAHGIVFSLPVDSVLGINGFND